MQALSLIANYNIKHMKTRHTQVVLTILGIALVVFVFLATLMLSEGIRYTLAITGDERNVIAVSIGSENEIQSGIARQDVAILLSQPEIAHSKDTPLASTDVVVVVTLNKRSKDGTSNVTLRGTSENAYKVRSQVSIIEGRLPARGTQEIIVGDSVNSKFAGTDIGESLRLVGTDWKVVGKFSAGNSAFSSEIWGDSDLFIKAFHREKFSSVVFRLSDESSLSDLQSRLDNDKRLDIILKPEREYYENQSKNLALFVKIIGLFVSVIFSLGAIIGAMITMYNSISNRTKEIGTLRALGFSKVSIMLAFMGECALIGLVGAIFALLFSTLLLNLTFATTNFDSFSDIAFGFRLTQAIVMYGIVFGLFMSISGGLLPVIMIGRLNLINALRRD